MPSRAFLPDMSVRTNVNIHLLRRTPVALTYGSLMRISFHPLCNFTGMGGLPVKFSFRSIVSLVISFPAFNHSGGRISSPFSQRRDPLRSQQPLSGARSFSERL